MSDDTLPGIDQQNSFEDPRQDSLAVESGGTRSTSAVSAASPATTEMEEAEGSADAESGLNPNSPDAASSPDDSASEPDTSPEVFPTPTPDPEAESTGDPDDAPRKPRVNPFYGASQFFSVRGVFAAGSLFSLTLVVCLLAVDLVWAMGIALLFTVAISTGHLVFYTRDRQMRERVYFGIVAIGAFCGGALITDLQLTHPYFIGLREFNQATKTLTEQVSADERFVLVKVSTKLAKIRVASFTGTVQKRHHLRALELLAEKAGFAVGENEVTVVDEPADPEEKQTTDGANEAA